MSAVAACPLFAAVPAGCCWAGLLRLAAAAAPAAAADVDGRADEGRHAARLPHAHHRPPTTLVLLRTTRWRC